MSTINIGVGVGKNICVAKVKGEYQGYEYRALVESTANYWIRVHDALEEVGVDATSGSGTKSLEDRR